MLRAVQGVGMMLVSLLAVQISTAALVQPHCQQPCSSCHTVQQLAGAVAVSWLCRMHRRPRHQHETLAPKQGHACTYAHVWEPIYTALMAAG